MRIIHVVQTLDPIYGGPPVTAVGLACAQAHLGHDVHIVSYIQSDAADIHAFLQRIPHVDRIQLSFLPKPSPWERIIGADARKTIVKLLPGAHMVHLHGVWDTIIRVAARAARRLRIPYFLTPHGMLDSWSMGQKAWKKRIALAMVYRKIINRAACLHVLNAAEAALLKPLGTTAPCCIIPNGVFLEETDCSQADCSEILHRHQVDGKPFVLFLSRLHYKKGLDYLADAFAIVSQADADLHLVVAGPDCGAQQAFAASIAKHGLTSRVHLIGPLYGAVKFSLLRRAACFCLPSRQEGFSIAILEALACSLPVVISESCHFPEVSSHGAGVVTPLDSDALGEAIKMVVMDKAARGRMAAAGRRLVEDHYSWGKVAERCLASYAGFL